MTREKLILAAINNFSEHGYHGATMAKIAKDVDIKPASIYYFFKNKEELFKAALEHILENHFTSMKRTFETSKAKPINDLLCNLLDSIVKHHTTYTEETRAYVTMITAPIPKIKETIMAYLDSYHTWLVKRLLNIIILNHPELNRHDIRKLIDYFIFIGNGLFWGVIIYNETCLQKNIEQAHYLINQYIIDNFGREYFG
ncbi:AcrR family transcriptional regulator [Cerasibacillus quisquiliarum]|uniref:HTH tetR-type domain-containing protein n=1 Tax=Cerasibacillus quisquiliarum TaxID=227865 RepID=A0A511UXX3_9BACI|nr:TetR/AcrR family transcriptional regulator [Cerasibacillus quisquiliarum]MBB5145128.1 AcrR family transcriptional regulator [Cerasibacillus quisquiliarum]GEN29982.1 hypothetical protein CQU01_02200 [Cerasibacillus quisquiliarum]